MERVRRIPADPEAAERSVITQMGDPVRLAAKVRRPATGADRAGALPGVHPAAQAAADHRAVDRGRRARGDRADLELGPIAVVDADLVAADGPALPGTTELATLVCEKGTKILGIGGDANFASLCDVNLAGPAPPESLAPLALVIPAQRALEALAREVNLDPDGP